MEMQAKLPFPSWNTQECTEIQTNSVELVMSEEVIVTQLLTKFLHLWHSKFVTVFAEVRHWTLSGASWIQPTSDTGIPSTYFLRLNLITFSHLHLGLPSGLFSWDLKAKFDTHFCFPPCMLCVTEQEELCKTPDMVACIKRTRLDCLGMWSEWIAQWLLRKKLGINEKVEAQTEIAGRCRK
jgi:hypothetical protein